MRHPTIQILPTDLLLGPLGARKRRHWPWRQLDVGDTISVVVPSHYVGVVRSGVCNHARADGSVKLVAEEVKRQWFGPVGHSTSATERAGGCWMVELLVTCTTGTPPARARARAQAPAPAGLRIRLGSRA